MNSEGYNWNNVRKFVAEQRGVPENALTPDTTLFGDLGLDGDDAYEFFQELQNHFGVSLEEFRLRRHFGSEGWPPHLALIAPLWMLWMARPGDPHRKAGVEPIRLSQLVSAVDAGRWQPTTGTTIERRPVV